MKVDKVILILSLLFWAKNLVAEEPADPICRARLKCEELKENMELIQTAFAEKDWEKLKQLLEENEDLVLGVFDDLKEAKREGRYFQIRKFLRKFRLVLRDDIKVLKGISPSLPKDLQELVQGKLKRIKRKLLRVKIYLRRHKESWARRHILR
jgi:hypothetical protein